MDLSDIQVDSFAPHRADTDYYIKLFGGLNINVFQCGDEKSNIKNYLNEIKSFNNLLKNNRYDCVHIHSGRILTLSIYSLVSKLNKIKKIIVHSHNSNIKESLKHIVVKTVCFPLLRYCPTDYCACSKTAGIWKFPKKIVDKKLVVLKNGIDLDTYNINENIRNEYRQKLNLKSEDAVIGHIGRFTEQKNHKFLIELFAEIKKKSDKYKLLLVGDGEFSDEIRTKVKNEGIEDSVIFTGNVNNVQDYMQAMDVFVLPSLFEGLPIVGVEAQASGLPTIFSTGVTEEAKLTDNVEYISLDDKKKWIETIERFSALPKADNAEKIRAAGYDIKSTAQIVREMYFKKC